MSTRSNGLSVVEQQMSFKISVSALLSPVAPLLGRYEELLLGSQQRITSPYGKTQGRAPRFFDSSSDTTFGPHVAMAEETFESCAPLRMQGNPVWVDATHPTRTYELTEIIEPIAGSRRSRSSSRS